MKHTNLNKKSHRLRPQQLVIQFTDRFQSLFQTLIIAHPLLDLRALLPTNAELPRLPTRVGYREHPDRMSSSGPALRDRKSTRLNSSHVAISYAVFCLKKKKKSKLKSNCCHRREIASART